MKQSFLLQEVINDIVDSDKSLSASLMKLLYFGRLTKNDELIKYTQQELNGYQGNDKNIPRYRQIIGKLQISVENIYGIQSKELAVSLIDESYRNSFKYLTITDGVTTLENLAKKSDNEKATGEVYQQLPIDLLPLLQETAHKQYRSDANFVVVDARLICNANVVLAILNAIRTRLLEFVMSVGEVFGYNIEIDTFNRESLSNNQTIIQQMNTTINNTGDGNVNNIGNGNQIENKAAIYKGNINRLEQELRKQGIEELDITELIEILQTEKPDVTNNRLGEGSNGWISKMINKSLNGIGSIATGLSSGLLVELIKQYYGMS